MVPISVFDEEAFLREQVAGSYGSAYTQGLQQFTGKEKVVQSVVTLKHYFAYSIERYSQPGSTDPAQSGVTRQNVDVKISAYDLAHTFFPAWEQTVGSCETCGHALGVMCSYNAVNGLPTCANPAMNHTLRGDWGFKGCANRWCRTESTCSVCLHL